MENEIINTEPSELEPSEELSFARKVWFTKWCEAWAKRKNAEDIVSIRQVADILAFTERKNTFITRGMVRNLFKIIDRLLYEGKTIRITGLGNLSVRKRKIQKNTPFCTKKQIEKEFSDVVYFKESPTHRAKKNWVLTKNQRLKARRSKSQLDESVVDLWQVQWTHL